MNESANNPSTTSQQSNSKAEREERIVDPRDLVYSGGSDRDPREVVENPAVTPELMDQAPEDLRDDLMPKNKDDDE